jgi:transketolase
MRSRPGSGWLGGSLQELGFRVFVLLGDGELHEGQIWEAALAAGHRRVRNLIAIVDRNGWSLDGRVEEVVDVEPLLDKWRSFGWDASEVDGHDVAALVTELRRVAVDTARDPAIVVAHTVKGKGVGFMEAGRGWHLGWLDKADEARARLELGAPT